MFIMWYVVVCGVVCVWCVVCGCRVCVACGVVRGVLYVVLGVYVCV